MSRVENELTIKEASQQLGCSDKTVRKYIKEGRLDARKLNGKKGLEYRINKNSLEKLLSLDFQRGNNGIASIEENGYISYKSLYIKAEEWNKDLSYKLEQANYRIGQLETTRLILTERSESLQKNESEFRDKITERDKELEIALKQIQEKEKSKKKYLMLFWGIVSILVISGIIYSLSIIKI